MYNKASRVAEEFIDHNEILDTIAYANEHKNYLTHGWKNVKNF